MLSIVIETHSKDFSNSGSPHSSYCHNNCNLIIASMKQQPPPRLGMALVQESCTIYSPAPLHAEFALSCTA